MREGNVIIGVDNCQGPFRTFKKILVATSQNHGTITTNAAGTQFTVCFKVCNILEKNPLHPMLKCICYSLF